jgi:hypothetical protein
LTLGGRLDTVKRFREYPERAVMKRLGGLWPALHWIQEIHRRVHPKFRGIVSLRIGVVAYLIAPATPSSPLCHGGTP